MPLVDLSKLGPLQIAEAVLIMIGAILGLGTIIHLAWRRRWSDAFRLTTAAPNQAELTDPLLGLFVFWGIPAVFAAVAVALAGNGTPQAGEPPSPLQITLVTLGQLVAAMALVGIGRRAFMGSLSGWGLRWRVPLRQLLGILASYMTIWAVCFGVLRVTVLVIETCAPEWEIPEHNAILTLQGADTPAWLWAVTAVGTLIAAPIGEELLFRGLLQPALARMFQSEWAAIICGGILFGCFHWSVPHTIPALACFGLALGYAYAKTRSLTFVILLHAVFNAKTVLWLFLAGPAE